MKEYRCLILILLLSFHNVFFGCNDSSIEISVDTQNKVLNSILKEAPLQVINLDEVDIDSIYIEEKNILGRVDDMDSSTPNFLFSVNGMIMMNDSIYVASSRHNNIWVMDREGDWVRTIGQEGKGPGEFGSLSGLYKNSRNIFAIDSGNSRIHVFDNNFNLIESLQVIIPWPRLKFIFTDSLMFIPAEPSEKKLIQIREIKPPFIKTDALLPKLIPLGKQPNAYNLFSIYSNNKDLIIATYYGLPYLFLFDNDLNQKCTLYFWSSDFDNFNNSPPIPVIAGPDERFSVMQYVNTISITEKDDIYLSTSTGRLYKIQLTSEGYRVRNGWEFYYKDSEFEKEKSIRKIRIHDMILDSNTLIISSEFTPYIFRLPKFISDESFF